ncbi:gamma tubulin complex Spc98/GCP3 subunit Alp6 [Schizosaccharomyces japonicus yFS275]|uniref:Gamma tubulin complex Spc98/GCP3 subunit Alp6 n=1 Tax=Schizosaccharomyces japonicus (strain yFS275 / FY16936) TaxID=402676 RepID=B6K0Q1_SCHJY|nr:gamma tubulin complex Spc98/GCP3 subunit Alp6 [Schizosaccharomyces japonicus yFS275]EEB07522.2 gamma tubulin complex Spc98/GCP3 subunit Alp6 [Schizosaccharomyces japonicus yFS275]
MSNSRVQTALSRLAVKVLRTEKDNPEKSSFERVFKHFQEITECTYDKYSILDFDELIALIYQSVQRNGYSSEILVRLSNLFSRLRTQSVIKQKSAVLYMLSLLSPLISKSKSTAPVHKIPRQNNLVNAPISVSPRIGKTTLATNATERQILSCVPFMLQGISTTFVTFTNQEAQLSKNIPLSFVEAVRMFSELGLLHRFFKDYTESSRSNPQNLGLILQSFKAALTEELMQFLGLIASLESHIRADELNTEKVVTIRKCAVWTSDALLLFRVFYSLIHRKPNQSGVLLLNAIYPLRIHGDPFLRDLGEKLLQKVSRPFYEMVEYWVYRGELIDPHNEFFIREKAENTHDNDVQGTGRIVWKGKYFVDDSLIPVFISPNLANKIFLIGKSLNFIKHGCGDQQWNEEHVKTLSKKLSFCDSRLLEAHIDEAYAKSNRHLVKLMEDKFHLSTHLEAIKKYILLGQGDFVVLLMESLGDSLDEPANTLFRHHLTASLESAIRSSNAAYEPDFVLKRLDARLLELSHGEIGWDVFTLEYRVDSPIDVIVTPYYSRQYLKIFNFLWRLKRIEFALSHSWRRGILGERNVLRNVTLVQAEWHFARCHIAEMIHFVCQLQCYILSEVIEVNWQELLEKLQKSSATLDTIIEAHHNYVTNITQKGLLGSGSSSSSKPQFLVQLHELLKNILSFLATVDVLYTFSVSLATKVQTGATYNENDTLQHLEPIQSALKEKASCFQTLLKRLLHGLATQPDLEMRFLSVRLNYNEFYSLHKRRAKRTNSGARLPY